MGQVEPGALEGQEEGPQLRPRATGQHGAGRRPSPRELCAHLLSQAQALGVVGDPWFWADEGT